LHASSNEFMEMEDKIFLYRFTEMDAKLDGDFKKSLYRKQAPVRKIIFTPNLMRASFAIAAMLILFIGLQLFKTESSISESNIVESNIVVAKFNEAQISSSSMETMASEEEETILPTIYKEIDTEEEDRTINIGILEIDGAAFRGITRKFSALLKRNKIEK